MDSWTLYKKLCNTSKGDEKIENVEIIVKYMYSEIFISPFDIKNSVFMKKIYENVNGEKSESEGNDSENNESGTSIMSRINKRKEKFIVMSTDAYIIVTALLQYIQTKMMNVEAMQEIDLKYLFKNGELANEKWKEDLREKVNRIKEIVDERNEKYLNNSKNQNEMINISKERENFNSRNMADHSLTNPTEQRRQSETVSGNSEEKTKKWNEEMAGIQSMLANMQPSVTKLLENFMQFSDKITENFVLKMARQQIDLYNLISGSYEYHFEQSQKSGNKDYINAIMNYDEFMYDVSDGLENFGVEEIISEIGMPFDGSIHDADHKDFSSRSALIGKSIRPGFKYNDIIIQKEKVELQEDNRL